jgi:two-component system response regulator DevR
VSCRVFLLDDQDTVRGGLRRLIEATEDLTVVGESGTVSGALDRILASRPDVALLDIRLPDGNGAEVGRQIHERCPEIQYLMLTGCPDDEARMASVEARAAGYLSKPVSGPDLRTAIRWVASRDPAVDVDAPMGAINRPRRHVLLSDSTMDPATHETSACDRGSLWGSEGVDRSPETLAVRFEKFRLARLLSELGID